MIPEIHDNAPREIRRAPGRDQCLGQPGIRRGGQATGRKTLIIAGTITSVCMAFPSISAVADGYRVFAVVDASGTYSKMAQEITLARIVQAGVVPMDTAAVASELQRTWNREDAAQWAQVQDLPAWLLIESHAKAQDVARNRGAGFPALSPHPGGAAGLFLAEGIGLLRQERARHVVVQDAVVLRQAPARRARRCRTGSR